jgi:hypothetical protein
VNSSTNCTRVAERQCDFTCSQPTYGNRLLSHLAAKYRALGGAWSLLYHDGDGTQSYTKYCTHLSSTNKGTLISRKVIVQMHHFFDVWRFCVFYMRVYSSSYTTNYSSYTSARFLSTSDCDQFCLFLVHFVQFSVHLTSQTR